MRFLEWLDKVRLEDKTKTYYRDGWRLINLWTEERKALGISCVAHKSGANGITNHVFLDAPSS